MKPPVNGYHCADHQAALDFYAGETKETWNSAGAGEEPQVQDLWEPGCRVLSVLQDVSTNTARGDAGIGLTSEFRGVCYPVPLTKLEVIRQIQIRIEQESGVSSESRLVPDQGDDISEALR